MSGDALKVAQFAQQFPRLAQKTDRIGSTEGTVMDAGLGMLGKTAALVPLRPLARTALLSDAAQDRFVKKPKPQAEARLLELVDEHNIDLVVLAHRGGHEARVRQVMSRRLVRTTPRAPSRAIQPHVTASAGP